jgi:hypothetical protein
MSKKTKRIRREMKKPGLDYLKRNRKAAQKHPKPKQEPGTIEMFLLRIKKRARVSATALSYLAGVALYTGLGALYGYPFTVFWIFIGTLIWCPLALGVLSFYEESLCTSRVFYSPRSWFRWFMDFFEDNFEQRTRDVWQIAEQREGILRIGIKSFCLPIYFVLLAIVLVLLGLVLLLDWIRLLIIGFGNLCFRITPTPNTREMLAWAYIQWAGIGAVVSLFFYSYKIYGNLDFTIYLLTGVAFGGAIGAFVSLYKGIRAKEHSTPYFPT